MTESLASRQTAPADLPGDVAACASLVAQAQARPAVFAALYDLFLPQVYRYLIGHTTWNDARVSRVNLAEVRLFDANGQELPVDPANFQDIGLDQTDPSQWAYRLYGLGFNGPLILRGVLANVDLTTPVTFTLDTAPDGFPAATPLRVSWPVGPLALDVLELRASLTQATFARQDGALNLLFDFQTDAALQQVPVTLEGGVTGAHSGGAGDRDAASGRARRLLAQLDNVLISNPVWSPDGQWLIASVTSNDPFAPVDTPVLLNLQSCQAFALGLEGTVQGWAK